MPEQLLNYFTNLTDDINAFLVQYALVEARFQEAFDRDIDTELQNLDFAGSGNLDHLTPDNLTDAFAAFTALQLQMDANDRARWGALLAVVRSWNS